MAWRIDEQVIRGEIDNRTRGKTTGRIWFVGRDKPVVLSLDGNPWRDLAGHVLSFSNPTPKPGLPDGLAEEQHGSVGDITASRKVKIPDVPIEEVMELCRQGRPFPWHWGNTLYLEWYGAHNGRVVIETAAFTLKLEGAPAWSMSEKDEIAQRCANAEAMTGFMGRLTAAVSGDEDVDTADADDADAPQSRAEAVADQEAARMDRLLDRVLARLEREPEADFETVLDEERERLRRERGEFEPETTPEESDDRWECIDETDALDDEAGESWKGEGRARHPLIERCTDLAVRMHHEVGRWLPQGASAEHPLAEVVSGVMIAGGKLAGALTSHDDAWPPEALFAGGVLVRLKKAREHLRDALSALDSADHENLATPAWRAFARHEIRAILTEVEGLIVEVRRVLSDGEE